jgi:hypothetical protein
VQIAQVQRLKVLLQVQPPLLIHRVQTNQVQATSHFLPIHHQQAQVVHWPVIPVVVLRVVESLVLGHQVQQKEYNQPAQKEQQALLNYNRHLHRS